MNNLSNINEISLALSNLQGELPTVEKNAKGYGYKYATLDKCMDVLKPLLLKHGLSISQPLVVIDNNLMVKTILMHKSGQFIESFCPCEINEKDKMSAMQRLGTAITYARRYSLSIIGLSTDEDTDDVPKKEIKKENNFEWSIPKLKTSCLKMVNNDKTKAEHLWNSINIDESKNYSQKELSNFFYLMKNKVNS